MKKLDKLDKLDRIFNYSMIGVIFCAIYELGNAEFISLRTIAIVGGGFAVSSLASFLFAMRLKSKELKRKERSLREKERFLKQKEEELEEKLNNKK